MNRSINSVQPHKSQLNSLKNIYRTKRKKAHHNRPKPPENTRAKSSSFGTAAPALYIHYTLPRARARGQARFTSAAAIILRARAGARGLEPGDSGEYYATSPSRDLASLLLARPRGSVIIFLGPRRSPFGSEYRACTIAAREECWDFFFRGMVLRFFFE